MECAVGGGAIGRAFSVVRFAELKDSFVDPVAFVTTRLGFVPDPKQELLLRGRMHRVLLNCSRQWGKSTITAAKAVHRAYTVPDSLVVVLGPGARQSAEGGGVCAQAWHSAARGWG